MTRVNEYRRLTLNRLDRHASPGAVQNRQTVGSVRARCGLSDWDGNMSVGVVEGGVGGSLDLILRGTAQVLS